MNDMGTEQKKNFTDKANLTATIITGILVALLCYISKSTYESTNETREKVAVLAAGKVNDTEKMADFKTQLTATQMDTKTQLAAISVRLAACEIEIVKLQRKAP